MGDEFFGPYLSERQWGTVREDYSFSGDCWKYCTHHDSLNTVYLHGEDGLFGWSDYKAKLCASVALWNGKDTILKERLFGLTGPQGNHGEDVKELYYYLCNVPNHNYMKALYQYPQTNFPYKKLIKQNRKRCFAEREYEIVDTGAFVSGYWDIYMEFAKEEEKTCLCRYTVHNQGSERATLYILPQIWLRDTWSHYSCDKCHTFSKPTMKMHNDKNEICVHYSEGCFVAKFDCGPDGSFPTMLFTENDSQTSNYTKDAFHRYIISNELTSVNPEMQGTKCGALYRLTVDPGESQIVQWCLYSESAVAECSNFKWVFEEILRKREKNAKNFYTMILSPSWTEEERNIACQAYSGLLWSKQFYCYDVRKWIESTIIRSERMSPESLFCASGCNNWTDASRNQHWISHLQNCDIISMPDKWEFPWYAAWDLAFHMIPYSFLDPDFSKKQLLLLLSDKYLHPNGQLPGCEFDFSDTNPPVHCWACLSVYHNSGSYDVSFLKKCFHRLLLNYNWWTNTNKISGPGHLYSGGFLGMDNISIFNRSTGSPPGYILAQADATGWMAFFCVKMFEMAIELIKTDPDYADIATQFFRHFLLIAENGSQSTNKAGFWHEDDKFFYDMLLSQESDTIIPLCIRSLVGLVPLLATTVIDLSSIRMNYPELFVVLSDASCSSSKVHIDNNKLFLSFVSSEQLQHILGYLFSETEFLSPFGIRSLSKHHEQNPYRAPVQLGMSQSSFHDIDEECHCREREEAKEREKQKRREEREREERERKERERQERERQKRESEKVSEEESEKVSEEESEKVSEEEEEEEEEEIEEEEEEEEEEESEDEKSSIIIMATAEQTEADQEESSTNLESDMQMDDKNVIEEEESDDDIPVKRANNRILRYSPGESPTNMFGGNSNWRGPIWLCMNFMLHECLDIYYKAFGNEYTVEFPTGSNDRKNLQDIRKEISKRIVSLFLPNREGCRPLHGNEPLYQKDYLRHIVLFYEYFNAENGLGCGASHQTGWSSIVVEFIRNLHS
ncbi:uncharacterized protein YMR196W [Octopus sinensis]|uniref:Uncharacterized protein YMR196W n=1 Tax=Octopus sinensis TaxID=2607531 RepID=A0A7E6EQL6_9MOLL|nr:uncharacterized protein YMR196W [Octopus sinensis]